jgi:two-component system sensor histidine kinase BaeS
LQVSAAGAGVNTLRRRLFAAVLGAVVVSVGLTVFVGAFLAHRTATRENEETVARRADLLAAQEGQRPSYIEEDYEVGEVRVIVRRQAAMAELLPEAARVDRPSDGRLSLEGDDYLYAYRPIAPRGLLVLRDESLGTPVWSSLLRDLLVAGAIGGVLAAGISYALAGSISRPVARVADASRALAAGSSPDPVPEEGPAELAALAQAFNDMARQLAASRESEREFLLSVSHELKTPLTAIRGYAEGLADGTFGAEDAARVILLEAGRLERLVRDLLDLARMNRHEFAVRREPIDLREVARDAVARHEAAARGFQVALTADGGPAWVEADHDRVLQVASNLVENALRLTPPGGSVTVRAEPRRLVVSDTGPGLDAEDVAHAFDRFFLYDKYGRERPVGSGLGLAIVRQLAVAMGGEVRVESAPAEGATFTLTLPAGADPRELVGAETASTPAAI